MHKGRLTIHIRWNIRWHGLPHFPVTHRRQRHTAWWHGFACTHSSLAIGARFAVFLVLKNKQIWLVRIRTWSWSISHLYHLRKGSQSSLLWFPWFLFSKNLYVNFMLYALFWSIFPRHCSRIAYTVERSPVKTFLGRIPWISFLPLKISSLMCICSIYLPIWKFNV